MWKAFQYVGCNFTNLPENANKIPGDSDIGGVGVIIAFVLTAWVTAVAATISSLRDWEIISYRFALGAEDLLGPLCDLQAVTGAAIIIGGFSQWNTITFYHRELVLSYWWLTSVSFWMSRRAYMYEAVATRYSLKSLLPKVTGAVAFGVSGLADVFAEAVKESKTGLSDDISWTKWRAYARRLLIIVSVFLGITWASSCNEIETHDWDESDPQKCYHYNDITYKSATTSWIWIVGLGVYQAALIWSLVDRKGTFQRELEYQSDRLEDSFKDWKDVCSKKAAEISCRCMLARFRRFLYGSLATTFFWIMFRSVQLIRVLISVWSYGDSDWRGFLLCYYALIMWNTWDIVMLKVMNQPLVEDETKIGFGQVLPLVLLVQIPLSMLDIWKDPAKQADRAGKEEIARVRRQVS